MHKMRIIDPPLYAGVFYLILFSSLAVHELGHIYAAEHIAKDCIFTETEFRLDLLVLRRSAMTYFTCSHGVYRTERPVVTVEWVDFTLPTVKVKAAEAGGLRQITSPLATGWFTALMGPALELIYVTWIVHWLSNRYRHIRVIRASYLLFLFMIFASSRMDFQQAVPEEHTALFIICYLMAYMAIALTHITFNVEYYRSLYSPVPRYVRRIMRPRC